MADNKQSIIKNFQGMKPSAAMKQIDFSKFPKEVREKIKGDLTGISDSSLDMHWDSATFKKWIESFADLYPAAFGIKEEKKVISTTPAATISTTKTETVSRYDELKSKISDLETRASVVKKMILKQPDKRAELKIRLKTIMKMIDKMKDELKTAKKKVVKKEYGGSFDSELRRIASKDLVYNKPEVKFDLGGSINGDKKFKYAITYTLITPESAEAGDYESQGFEKEYSEAELSDILKDAVNNYGIYYTTGTIPSGLTFETVSPAHDSDFFEKGHEKYYQLHIKNIDDSEITLSEKEFISKKLSDSRKLNWDTEDKEWYKDGGTIHSKDKEGLLVFKADTKGGKYSIEVREMSNGKGYDYYSYTNGSARGMGSYYTKETLIEKIVEDILGSKKIDGINYLISVDSLYVNEILPYREKLWDTYESKEFKEWVKTYLDSLSEEEKQSMADGLKNKSINYIKEKGYPESDFTVSAFFKIYKREKLLKEFYKSKGLVVEPDKKAIGGVLLGAAIGVAGTLGIQKINNNDENKNSEKDNKEQLISNYNKAVKNWKSYPEKIVFYDDGKDIKTRVWEKNIGGKWINITKGEWDDLFMLGYERRHKSENGKFVFYKPQKPEHPDSFKNGGSLDDIKKDIFISKVNDIHNEIKEVVLQDGTHIDGKDLMKDGGELSSDEYYDVVNHFVYFCLNYPNNFSDAFDSEGDGIKKHIEDKFRRYYEDYGSYGAMIKLWSELDSENQKLLADWIKENYKGTPLSYNGETKGIINHFVMFCFNYPRNFFDAFGDKQNRIREHIEHKFSLFYEKYGSVAVMIKFWSELDRGNQKILANWIKNNYKGATLKYSEGGGIDNAMSNLHKKVTEDEEFKSTKRNKFKVPEVDGKKVDLFAYPDLIPKEIQKILDKYWEEFNDSMSYDDTARMQKEIEEVGYTFDSGLDNVPYGLRKIGVELNELEGYENLAKGGNIGERVFLVKNIKYDTDSKTKSKLPKELTIKVPSDIQDYEDTEYYISEEISNITGYTHNGFDTSPDIEQMKDGGGIDEWKSGTTIKFKTKKEAEKRLDLMKNHNESGTEFKNLHIDGDLKNGYFVKYDFIKKNKMAGGGKVNDTPRIYVADLAAYNQGKHVGEWVDLDEFSSGEEVMEKISELLKKWSKKQKVKREEFAIHDFENFPKDFYSEYMGKEDFDKLVEYLEAVKGSDFPKEVIEEYASNSGQDMVDAISDMDDNYQGKYDDAEDFAYQTIQDIGMPNNPENYIYVSDTDRRIIANEEADNRIEDMDEDDIILEADMEDEVTEYEDKEKEIEELEEEISSLDEEEDSDEIKEKQSKLEELRAELSEMDNKEKILEKAKEELHDEIYEEWYDGLEDPYNFLVEEQGLYDSESLLKQSFIVFDYKKFAKELEWDYNFIEHDGEVYVFRQN